MSKRAGNRTGRDAKRRRRRHERRTTVKRPVSGHRYTFASVVVTIGGVPFVPFKQFNYTADADKI
jgi:hypothetical protein